MCLQLFFNRFVPLVSLIVFMIGFSIGFGSIPFVLMGEIFPAAQRSLLSSIAISFNVAVMFLVVKTYHPLEDAITPAGTFWMYSAFCALGAIFVIFCVPETKGRELESMATVFRKSFRVLRGKSANIPSKKAMKNGTNGTTGTVMNGDKKNELGTIESTKV